MHYHGSIGIRFCPDLPAFYPGGRGDSSGSRLSADLGVRPDVHVRGTDDQWGSVRAWKDIFLFGDQRNPYFRPDSDGSGPRQPYGIKWNMVGIHHIFGGEGDRVFLLLPGCAWAASERERRAGPGFILTDVWERLPADQAVTAAVNPPGKNRQIHGIGPVFYLTIY